MAPTEETAFPRLTGTEPALVKPLAESYDYADGDVVFRVGQPDIDLHVVESGRWAGPARGRSRTLPRHQLVAVNH